MPWALNFNLLEEPHWFIAYVLNCESFQFGFLYPFQSLKLVEQELQQLLPNIVVCKIFKDKFSRLHYFSTSTEQEVHEFVNSLSPLTVNRSTVQDYRFPNKKVVRLHFEQSFLYCLPQVNTQIRTSSRG